MIARRFVISALISIVVVVLAVFVVSVIALILLLATCWRRVFERYLLYIWSDIGRLSFPLAISFAILGTDDDLE
jgi:hypothetical protein